MRDGVIGALDIDPDLPEIDNSWVTDWRNPKDKTDLDASGIFG